MAIIKNKKILKCLLMMVVSLLLILYFSIEVSASTNYDRQEVDAYITISQRVSVKGGTNQFPTNPDDFLSEITRQKVTKTNGTQSQTIYTSDNVRIRAEQHPLLEGETYKSRHHGLHYHVEYRIDNSLSWNKKIT